MRKIFKSCSMMLMASIVLPPMITGEEGTNEILAKIVNAISQIKDDLEERVAELEKNVDKLEDLAKIGTLRSCSEYARYGLKNDGLYMIDPDGSLLGEEPFQVFCNFTSGATEVLHDRDFPTEIGHCHDPGCFNKTITYINGLNQAPLPFTQIVSLIELAEYCTQEIQYDCTLAPLSDNDINYAYWEDRQGEQNVYFTGSNNGFHVCDCHFEEPQCIDEETEHNTCNCDANLPIPTADTGVITNMTALPVMKMFFGGLSYDLQYAAVHLGRLKCFGSRPVDIATSCSALKRTGVFKSGYYHIKGLEDLYASLVYCNMQSTTYTDVPQQDQPNADSPLGTILSWISKPEEDIAAMSSLPDGWVLCDGSTITKGLWAGGKTPDIINGGHFLRGGTEDEMLMFEEDQVLDHQHVDNGHSHSASSTAADHHHGYTDNFYSFGRGGDKLCKSHTGCTKDAVFYTESKTSKDATVSVSTTISSNTAGLAGVSSTYRAGTETRPRNMRVQWIMRCW